jgi:hypothetical protein
MTTRPPLKRVKLYTKQNLFFDHQQQLLSTSKIWNASSTAPPHMGTATPASHGHQHTIAAAKHPTAPPGRRRRTTERRSAAALPEPDPPDQTPATIKAFEFRAGYGAKARF